jgi:hypothetical protein
MRLGGMTIVKQEDMEVLGVDLSPFMSIMDWAMEPFLSFWMHAYLLADRTRVSDHEAE